MKNLAQCPDLTVLDWDTKPFVLSLCLAVCRAADSHTDPSLAWLSPLRGSWPGSGQLPDVEMRSIPQKLAHRCALGSLFPQWLDFLKDKLHSLLFRGECRTELYDIPSLPRNLKSLSSHISLTYIKTVCNAWTASCRLHLPERRQCIFGCTADDSFLHYAQCGTLASAVDVALKQQLPVFHPSIFTLLLPPRVTNTTS